MSASSRASAPRSGRWTRAGATLACTDLGAGLPAGDRRADHGLARREGRAARRATSSTAIDGEPWRGQHRSTRPASRVRGPKDTTVVLSIVRGGGAPFDVEIVRAVIVQPEVETREPRRAATVGYIKLSGLLGPRRGPVRRGGPGRRRRRRAEADPRPARQPGRLRDGGPRHRERVPRRRHDLLAGGRRRQPRSRPSPSRAARPRTPRSSSSSWSTAAPRRRPRSWPARSTTAAARRWSGRRRSARAPSSSGPSSRTTAAASG